MSNGDLGARVRAFREWRGMSLRTCAGLAGIPRSTLSDMERGLRPLDRKSHIDALALALRIAPTELVGQPYPPEPGDSQRSHAQAGVDAIRGALMDVEMGAVPEPRKSLDELAAVAQVALTHHAEADLATTMRLLPTALAGLPSYLDAADEAVREKALKAAVSARVTACHALIAVGYRDLAWVAASQARRASELLGEPAYVGRADFAMTRAMAPYSRRARYAEQAVENLAQHAGRDDLTAQMYGTLHLMAAYDAAVVGGDAHGHLAAAQEVADRLGDGRWFGMDFGPTNVTIFRISIAVELGEGGKVAEFGPIRPGSVSRHRCGNYHRDMFRALAQAGKDSDAMPHLLEAERLFPEELRNNALARQAVIDMLRRARRAVSGSDLAGVAQRMGVS